MKNPEYLTKDRLKSELKKHGVTFDVNENKDYYVQLYRKHVLKGKSAGSRQRSEFSSDEELVVRHSPRLPRKHMVQVSTKWNIITIWRRVHLDPAMRMYMLNVIIFPCSHSAAESHTATEAIKDRRIP